MLQCISMSLWYVILKSNTIYTHLNLANKCSAVWHSMRVCVSEQSILQKLQTGELEPCKCPCTLYPCEDPTLTGSQSMLGLDWQAIKKTLIRPAAGSAVRTGDLIRTTALMMIASLMGPWCLHYVCRALCVQPPHRSYNKTIYLRK